MSKPRWRRGENSSRLKEICARRIGSHREDLMRVWPAMADAPASNPALAIARNGNYGVTILFVISGFLITRKAFGRRAPWERSAAV